MWPWYAVVAMACFAAMQLLFRHLDRQGITTPAMLMFIFAFGTLLYVLHVSVMRTAIPTTASAFGLLGLTAVLSYVGNLYSVRAVAAAPNPGYAVAIVGLQAAAVTLISILLFGATMSWIKGLGVVLCCIGIALLVI
jgi:drug/metabolite transporter (DMT)-like permease